MNKEQEFTPKYWVGHDNKKDDVFLETAGKSRMSAILAMAAKFGIDWADKKYLSVDLVEIKLV